jgi:hypothetical protein
MMVMISEQIKESLEREFRNLRKEIREFRKEMTVRFDNQNARLDRLTKLEGRPKRAS